MAFPFSNCELNYTLALHDSVDRIFASKAALALKDLASPTQELCGDCQLYYECDGCHGLAYNLKVNGCRWRSNFEKILCEEERSVV